ncbi:MAG: hypothetical protein ABI691_13070 [Ginsengibacter sp.]
MNIKKLTGKLVCCFLLCMLNTAVSFCQEPVKSFAPGMYTPDEYAALRKIIGKNKKIPAEYEKQILIALSYFPKLTDIQIVFRFKHTNTSFSTRPTILSVFRKSSRRKYIVTISDSSKQILVPLQLNNLDYNAQIGVMGHELTHAADFTNKKTFGLLQVAFGNLSNKYLDRLERKTDSLCIAHGLGYQLLAWSSFIRTTMHRENWTGSVNINKGPMLREKYMNPSTIINQIELEPLYANTK